MTGTRAPLALAALLLAAPAPAYQRSADSQTGKELFWPLPAVAYGVNVTRPATSPGAPSCGPGVPDLGVEAVRASFSAWNQPCSNLDLVYAGTRAESRTGLGGTADDVVTFRRGWCSSDPQVRSDPCYADPDVDCGNLYGCFEDHTPDDKRVVAYTVTLYDPRTGAIVDGDIEVNGWDGIVGGPLPQPSDPAPRPPPTNGWYFTCENDARTCTGPLDTGCLPLCTTYGQGGCMYMDLRNTVTHEAGHFVGLAHTGVPTTTMFGSTSPGETEKRTLSLDDVAGVCAIYPKPSGCSSAGEGAGAASVALAAAAWRRRRRGRRHSTAIPA